MNKRLKSTAILMALIITLSAFTSLAATTAVAAATTTPAAEAATTAVEPTTATSTTTPAAVATATPPIVAATATTTTITASPTNPAVGQSVTFTVTVKAGTTVLANKQVTVTHTYPGGTSPGSDGVKNTGSSGVLTFTQSFGSTGQRVYTAAFAGDSTYAASSGTATVNVGTTKATTVTLTASTTSPSVGHEVTFTATLKAGSTPLAGKSVTIDVAGGAIIVTETTDSMGQVNTSVIPMSLGTISVVAKFTGDTTYGASTSQLTVTPINYKEQSSIWLTTDKTCWGYASGGTVRVTATLAKGYLGTGTPITGAYVTIYEQESNGGALIVAAQGYTDAQGQLTTTRIMNSWGYAQQYTAVFAETTSYLGSRYSETVYGC